MSMILKPYKKEFEHSYVFGVYPVLTLLERRHSLAFSVLLSEKVRGQGFADKIEGMCAEYHIPLSYDEKAISRLNPKENCLAVAAFHKKEEKLSPDNDHLVLVNPSDMGNLGTIIRTATGFSVRDIAIITPAADNFDPKCVRASMGACFISNVKRFESFEAYSNLYNRSYFPFMLTAEPGLHIIRQTKKPRSLIFGNEGAGLPDMFHTVGTPVRIAHSDDIDSLNLTVAVGIGLYELTSDIFN